MSNPLMNVFGQQNQTPANMLQAFNRFRQQFTGNPEQEVKRLLSTGQMSQSQYQQLSQMARSFGSMFK